MLGDQDTIAAIATARGIGALSLVRLSGSATADVVKKCFSNKEFFPEESHRAFYGVWKNPITETAIDEVVVLNFSAGRGFTGGRHDK